MNSRPEFHVAMQRVVPDTPRTFGYFDVGDELRGAGETGSEISRIRRCPSSFATWAELSDTAMDLADRSVPTDAKRPGEAGSETSTI